MRGIVKTAIGDVKKKEGAPSRFRQSDHPVSEGGWFGGFGLRGIFPPPFDGVGTDLPNEPDFLAFFAPELSKFFRCDGENRSQNFPCGGGIPREEQCKSVPSGVGFRWQTRWLEGVGGFHYGEPTAPFHY